MVINQAIEKNDAHELKASLGNPATMLIKVNQANVERYLPVLCEAKRNKVAVSGVQDLENSDEMREHDVYEVCLTREEIQENLDTVNTIVNQEIAQAKCECVCRDSVLLCVIRIYVHVINTLVVFLMLNVKLVSFDLLLV